MAASVFYGAGATGINFQAYSDPAGNDNDSEDDTQVGMEPPPGLGFKPEVQTNVSSDKDSQGTDEGDSNKVNAGDKSSQDAGDEGVSHKLNAGTEVDPQSLGSLYGSGSLRKFPTALTWLQGVNFPANDPSVHSSHAEDPIKVEVHIKGECKPCPYFQADGCRNGHHCALCHICDREAGKKFKKATRLPYSRKRMDQYLAEKRQENANYRPPTHRQHLDPEQPWAPANVAPMNEEIYSEWIQRQKQKPQRDHYERLSEEQRAELDKAWATVRAHVKEEKENLVKEDLKNGVPARVSVPQPKFQLLPPGLSGMTKHDKLDSQTYGAAGAGAYDSTKSAVHRSASARGFSGAGAYDSTKSAVHRSASARGFTGAGAYDSTKSAAHRSVSARGFAGAGAYDSTKSPARRSASANRSTNKMPNAKKAFKGANEASREIARDVASEVQKLVASQVEPSVMASEVEKLVASEVSKFVREKKAHDYNKRQNVASSKTPQTYSQRRQLPVRSTPLQTGLQTHYTHEDSNLLQNPAWYYNPSPEYYNAFPGYNDAFFNQFKQYHPAVDETTACAQSDLTIFYGGAGACHVDLNAGTTPGLVRSFGSIVSFDAEKNSGCISSPSAYAAFGKEISLSSSEIKNFKAGDIVSFDVAVNADGNPEARNLEEFSGF